MSDEPKIEIQASICPHCFDDHHSRECKTDDLKWAVKHIKDVADSYQRQLTQAQERIKELEKQKDWNACEREDALAKVSRLETQLATVTAERDALRESAREYKREMESALERTDPSGEIQKEYQSMLLQTQLERDRYKSALEKIADITSAMKDGRTVSLRDYEMREIADQALTLAAIDKGEGK